MKTRLSLPGLIRQTISVFLLSFLIVFSSCQLFENDVQDFMEKYTETAAIETHNISVPTYNDALSQRCIASEEDTEITMYMRNPKKFHLVPSVTFPELNAAINRASVDISQTDANTIILSLPQDFLIPADEGQSIYTEIRLYEPMSGRDFDRYKIKLHCNTKPPLLLNPTIINNSNSTFVVAFDMPSPEEVAVRHKDISEIEINGISYPVTITTVADPEVEGAFIAQYAISDSHFTRTSAAGYNFIGQKEFTTNAATSFYYETGDAFFHGDKEYTLVLKDSAGLKSEVKASTTIAKLLKPVILDQTNFEIQEGPITVAPFDEDSETGTITIIPPTQDHLSHPVSGATVHYKVYEATGSGRIYTSGTTTTAKTITLPQNTYRVEAYATLTNYENSATNTVKFRFMNSVIYVEAVTDLSAPNAENLTTGDGSAAAPFPTIADVIADINANRTGNDRKPKYTIYLKGDFTSPTYSKEDPAAPHDYGSVVLDSIETDELIFKKWQNASEAKLKSINIAATSTLQKVTIGDITVTNSSGDGITHSSSNTLIIDGTTITGCTGTGARAIQQTAGSLIIKNCNVTNNSNGLAVAGCTLCEIRNGLFESNTGVAVYFAGSGTYTISGGTFKNNNISGGNAAIWIYTDSTADCTISGGVIKENNAAGILVAPTYSSVLKLYGGEISYNAQKGIDVETTATLRVKGNPVVQNNTMDSPASTANVVLTAGKTITIDGPLTAGAKIGVRTATTNEPDDIGETYTFANGYVNSGSPSQYFTSDRGFSIVAGTGGAVSIAKSGSSGGMGNAFDYAMTFAFEKEGGAALTRFASGEVTPIYIRPTITRAGTSVAYADIKNSISWTIKLYNGGTYLGTLPIAENGTERIKVNLPSSLVGSYIVEVSANLISLSHPGSCTLNCVDPNNIVASPVSSLTAPPTAATHPYLTVSTAAEFDTLAEWSSSNDFEGITITLQNDVTVSNDLIIKQFKGTFDGADYTITQNITTDQSSGSVTLDNGTTIYNVYKSLFWNVDGNAVIKNLKTTGTAKKGGIVGVMNNGLIENCISETVISSSYQGAAYLAGIVSNLKGGIVRNCINKGTIYTTINNNTSSAYSGGGIASMMSGGSIIENCINYGNIGTPDDEYNRIGMAGGIVGYYNTNTGIIRNCKNFGTIIGTLPAGIISKYGNNLNGNVNNNSNHGNVYTAPLSSNKNSGIIGDANIRTSIGNIQNNCNTVSTDNGLISNLINGNYDWDTDNPLPEGIVNNFSINTVEAMIGPLAHPEKNDFTLNDIYENQNVTFAASDASSIKDTLNAWVTTANNAAGEVVYKNWKINDEGVPEVDLGELDNQ